MNLQNIIAFDVDDTVVDLMTPWLKCYNKDYNDNLTKEQITDWDLTKFVKPECGTKIYDYVKTTKIYKSIKLVPGVKDVIDLLKSYKIRVIFITVVDYNTAKIDCLKRLGVLDSSDDYVVAHDKSLVNFDYLIDDNGKIVESLGYDRAVLFDEPWNKSFTNYTFENERRIMNWKDFLVTVKGFVK
jgi:5'-nucleotidase